MINISLTVASAPLCLTLYLPWFSPTRFKHNTSKLQTLFRFQRFPHRCPFLSWAVTQGARGAKFSCALGSLAVPGVDSFKSLEECPQPCLPMSEAAPGSELGDRCSWGRPQGWTAFSRLVWGCQYWHGRSWSPGWGDDASFLKLPSLAVPLRPLLSGSGSK